MNIDKSLYVPTAHQNPPTAVDVRRTIPVVKVGAILDVLVARQHNRNNYSLQVGKDTLQATSERPLPVGSRQVLKVLNVDTQGRLTTQVLSPTESRIAQALLAKTAVAQSLTQLYQNLPQAARPAAGLPPSVQQWAARLLAATPTRNDVVQPDKLAQALRNSGVFLEASLARGSAAPAQDTKSLLLNLLNQLLKASPARPGAPLPQTYAPSSKPAVSSQTTPAATSTPNTPLRGQPQSITPAPQSTAPQNTAPARTSIELPVFPSPGSSVSASSARPSTYGVPATPTAAHALTPPALSPQTALPQNLQATTYQQAAHNRRGELAQAANYQESAPSLLRVVEAGLARLESQQLVAAQGRENQQLMWLLELPVRNGQEIDVWQFYLRREERSTRQASEQNEVHWRVSLNVALGALGELAVEVDYAASETQLVFYSKNPDILALIQQRQDDLVTRLNTLGVEQTRVEAHFGELPEASRPPQYQPALDARA